MPKPTLKTVNIDLPLWLLRHLDQRAAHLGITRKALINVLLAKSIQEDTKSSDRDYLRTIEDSFDEWKSEEDEEAFRDL